MAEDVGRTTCVTIRHPSEQRDVVAKHAEQLMYHDTGDAEFAAVALRFAQRFDELVRRVSSGFSGQGQVLQVIADLADEDRSNGTVLGSKDRVRLHADKVMFLKSVLPHAAAFDLATRRRIEADLDALLRVTLSPVLYAPIRTVVGRLITDGLAFVDAYPAPLALPELRRDSATRPPLS